MQFPSPRVALVLLSLLAFALRTHALGERSLWIDEAASVAFATMPFDRFWRTLSEAEANASLYYLLLRGWTHFGTSETFVRSLSVLFSLATLPLLFSLAKRLFNASIALDACALLTLHLAHLLHAQEARSFSLALCFLLLASNCFLELQNDRRKPHIELLYVLSCVGAIYSHLLCCFVLIAHWTALRFLPSNLSTTVALRTNALVLLCSSPLFLHALQHRSRQGDWIAPTSLTELFLTLLLVTGANPFFLVGVFRSLRTPSLGNERFTAVLLVFPVLSIALVSLFKPLFFFKYFVLVVPYATLLAAVGLASSTWLRRLAYATSAVLVVFYFRQFEHWGDDWRSATTFLQSNSRSTDAAVFHISGSLHAYHYYVQPSGAQPTVVFPAPNEFASADIPLTIERLQQAAHTHQRVWLVLHHVLAPRDVPLRQTLERTHRSILHRSFPGLHPMAAIHVTLYERRTERLQAATETVLLR